MEVTVATAPTEVEDVEVPTPPILTQLNPGPLAPNDSPMEVPLYAKLHRRLAWWRLHATPEVVEIIAHGLPAPWIAPPPIPNFPYHRHTPEEIRDALKPVRTPVAILGSLGVCIYVPASRHWLISYSPIHLI